MSGPQFTAVSYVRVTSVLASNATLLYNELLGDITAEAQGTKQQHQTHGSNFLVVKGSFRGYKHGQLPPRQRNKNDNMWTPNKYNSLVNLTGLSDGYNVSCLNTDCKGQSQNMPRWKRRGGGAEV